MLRSLVERDGYDEADFCQRLASAGLSKASLA
jgi:hypothetical protein